MLPDPLARDSRMDGATLVMDIAPAAGMSRQFLVAVDIGIAATAGIDLAVIGYQIITVEIAATAGVDIECTDRATEIGVRTARLGDVQIVEVQFSAEIASTRKVHFETPGMDRVLDINVAAAGSFQLIDLFAGDIGPEAPMVTHQPAEVAIVDVDAKDAARHFRNNTIAIFGVGGAYGNCFFTALAQVEVDAGRDLDAMKSLDIAFLCIPVIKGLAIGVLGNGKQGGEGEKAEQYSIFHDDHLFKGSPI